MMFTDFTNKSNKSDKSIIFNIIGISIIDINNSAVLRCAGRSYSL